MRPNARIAETTRERFGRIDGLVNSAFFWGSNAAADAADLQAWKAVYDTNLIGTMQMIQAVVPVMKAGGRGAIVIISTMATIKPHAGEAGYAAAANVPLRRLVTDDECARAALFLVPDCASAITGATLDANGGDSISVTLSPSCRSTSRMAWLVSSSAAPVRPASPIRRRHLRKIPRPKSALRRTFAYGAVAILSRPSVCTWREPDARPRPAAHRWSARSAKRWTFPDAVVGNSVTKCMRRGTL